MYRTIDAAFWTDPKVRSLSKDNHLLLLYLITNPHTHVSGIYYLPLGTIAHETVLPLKEVIYGIDTLSKAGFCRFDHTCEIVWVKNMMKYQGHGEKTIKSAAHHIIEDLHHTPLIAEFLEAYPLVKTEIGNRVSIRYPEKSSGATPDSLFPIPDSLFPIPDSDQDTVTETPAPKKRAGRADPAAELFKVSYQENIGNPYEWLKGDFQQLAKLRHRLGIETDGTPPDWEIGIENYFASPFSEFSLRHFVEKFDTFKNSPLDRFNKPVNHVNGGNRNGQRKSRADITRENGESILRDLENKRRLQHGIESRDPNYLRK